MAPVSGGLRPSSSPDGVPAGPGTPVADLHVPEENAEGRGVGPGPGESSLGGTRSTGGPTAPIMVVTEIIREPHGLDMVKPLPLAQRTHAIPADDGGFELWC